MMHDEGSDPAKQFLQADLQTLANLFDVDQGEIPDATFNAAVIGAVKPASFRCFFLANPLPFAHTTDCATKPDADVGWHELPLSPGASHTATADESHISETVFAIPKPKLDLANVANHHVH
jgi:hypothetical protein